MKMLVLGYVRRSGNAKATGKAFDFAQIIGTHEVEIVAGEKYQQTGGGFDKLEVPLSVDALPHFKGLKFPGVYDLKMDHRPGNRGQIETICVGLEKPVASAVA